MKNFLILLAVITVIFAAGCIGQTPTGQPPGYSTFDDGTFKMYYPNWSAEPAMESQFPDALIAVANETELCGFALLKGPVPEGKTFDELLNSSNTPLEQDGANVNVERISSTKGAVSIISQNLSVGMTIVQCGNLLYVATLMCFKNSMSTQIFNTMKQAECTSGAPTIPETNVTGTNVETPAENPVTGNIESMLLSQSNFPVPGFIAKEPTPIDGGWEINFEAEQDNGYFWYDVSLISLGSIDANYYVNYWTCGGQPDEQVTQVAVSVGDAAKACVYDAGKGYRTFNLMTGTRNISVLVQAAVYDETITNNDVVKSMADLTDTQLIVIDQLSPPGPAMLLTTGTPKFHFDTPAALQDAQVGINYIYSFCEPRPQTNTSACGTFPVTINPKGGYPPYHFIVQNGFPPFGIHCGKDGICQGTPAKATAGKTVTFEICAIDLSADYVCRRVSLTVVSVGDLAILTGVESRTPGGVLTLEKGGTVTSAPAGINCLGDCSETYGEDARVTLTATPKDGWEFTGWTGACIDVAGNTCTITKSRASRGANNHYTATAYALFTIKWTPAAVPATFSINPSSSCRCIGNCNAQYDKEIEYTIRGTASGPVGTVLVMPGLSGYIDEEWTSSWGDSGSKVESRDAGEPETTDWTAVIVVSSSGRTVDGFVRDENNEKITDSMVVSC